MPYRVTLIATSALTVASSAPRWQRYRRACPSCGSKAAVPATTAFVLSLWTNLLTFPLAQSFLTGTEHEAALGDPGVLRALTGNATGLALLSVLGLGALARSLPIATSAFIGLVM
jgi:ABC-2 type transport system permease protein